MDSSKRANAAKFISNYENQRRVATSNYYKTSLDQINEYSSTNYQTNVNNKSSQEISMYRSENGTSGGGPYDPQ